VAAEAFTKIIISEALELLRARRRQRGGLMRGLRWGMSMGLLHRLRARFGDAVRELAMARWGMPSPKRALKGRTTDPGVTNIRNVTSPHWRRWLVPEHRCLVPFTSFSEYDTIDGKKVPVWFALDESRPIACFAGLWTSWTSTRRKAEGERISRRCPPKLKRRRLRFPALPSEALAKEGQCVCSQSRAAR
jgi:hypothetical protein